MTCGNWDRYVRVANVLVAFVLIAFIAACQSSGPPQFLSKRISFKSRPTTADLLDEAEVDPAMASKALEIAKQVLGHCAISQPSDKVRDANAKAVSHVERPLFDTGSSGREEANPLDEDSAPMLATVDEARARAIWGILTTVADCVVARDRERETASSILRGVANQELAALYNISRGVSNDVSNYQEKKHGETQKILDRAAQLPDPPRTTPVPTNELIVPQIVGNFTHAQHRTGITEVLESPIDTQKLYRAYDHMTASEIRDTENELSSEIVKFANISDEGAGALSRGASEIMATKGIDLKNMSRDSKNAMNSTVLQMNNDAAAIQAEAGQARLALSKVHQATTAYFYMYNQRDVAVQSDLQGNLWYDRMKAAGVFGSRSADAGAAISRVRQNSSGSAADLGIPNRSVSQDHSYRIRGSRSESMVMTSASLHGQFLPPIGYLEGGTIPTVEMDIVTAESKHSLVQPMSGLTSRGGTSGLGQKPWRDVLDDAACELQLGNYYGAVGQARCAILMRPEAWEGYFVLFMANISARCWDSAAKCLEDALSHGYPPDTNLAAMRLFIENTFPATNQEKQVLATTLLHSANAIKDKATWELLNRLSEAGNTFDAKAVEALGRNPWSPVDSNSNSRVFKDGLPSVPMLRRMSDAGGALIAVPVRELRRLRLGGYGSVLEQDCASHDEMGITSTTSLGAAIDPEGHQGLSSAWYWGGGIMSTFIGKERGVRESAELGDVLKSHKMGTHEIGFVGGCRVPWGVSDVRSMIAAELRTSPRSRSLWCLLARNEYGATRAELCSASESLAVMLGLAVSLSAECDDSGVAAVALAAAEEASVLSVESTRSYTEKRWEGTSLYGKAASMEKGEYLWVKEQLVPALKDK